MNSFKSSLLRVLLLPLGSFFVWGHPVMGATVQQIKQQTSGTYLVVDVRSEKSYQQGHIPGSLNWPLASLHRYWSVYPRDGRPVYFYCRCPHDEASKDAAHRARQMGFKKADVIEGGLSQWERWEIDATSQRSKLKAH
jgi:rhodanese-related sulfurtransferase